MTLRFRSDADGEVERSRAPKVAGTGPPPPSGPDDYGVSDAAVAGVAPPFKVERWAEIAFDFNEEFLIDGVLPKRGVGLMYGASQTFKSFSAKHQGLCVARGHPWAGRKTENAPVVYLAAEGAAGLRKRKAGYVKAGRAPPNDVDFTLISAAPNLGADKEDCGRLVATIEAARIKPGLIIIDTVAKVIGGSDENGAGMAQFLLNAEALAQHFDCFVLAVHHTGWNDDAKDRPRGWSGLPAALDMQILCERRQGEMSATLTIQKLKDEPSGLRLNVQMMRVVLGVSKTGREVSTLIVDTIEEAAASPLAAPPKKPVPAGQRLLSDIIAQAIVDGCESIKPSPDGAIVRAVFDDLVRDRYYAAIAERADADEDPSKLADRKRKAFNRALKAMLDAKLLLAREIEGRRMLWLP